MDSGGAGQLLNKIVEDVERLRCLSSRDLAVLEGILTVTAEAIDAELRRRDAERIEAPGQLAFSVLQRPKTNN